MDEITKFGLIFSNHELYWSSLLVAQEKATTLSYDDSFFMFNSLFHLGFYKKLQQLIELDTKLLKAREIKLLYIKSGKVSTVPSTHTIQTRAPVQLDYASIELFFSALTKKETLRKQQFIESFQKDKRNIEPLIYLYKESLASMRELCALIEKISIPCLKELMKLLISGSMSTDTVICPLAIFSKTHKILFEDEMAGDCGALFGTCARNLDFFNNCEFLYQGMGMYYLEKDKYKEALNCFYKAIELNKHFGVGYFLAGICHSRLKETEYAVKLQNNAYSILSSSYLPAYTLAYEYQIMNNIPKAKHYYRRCIELMDDTEVLSDLPLNKKHRLMICNPTGHHSVDSRVIYSFIHCLIYNEEYEEAMRYLEQFEVKNVLRVFCFLFIGQLDEARYSLEECEKDEYYFVCKGFISHLVDDLDVAIKNYEQGLNFGANPVLENLLSMAYENKGNIRPNRAFDYSNCLFESFGFKRRLF